MPDVDASTLAFLEGVYTVLSQTSSYLLGGSEVLDDISAFLEGDVFGTDSTPAFTYGEDALSSSRFAFLYGIVRGNTSAYLEGSVTGEDDVVNDYITLRSSDSSIDKKFKVLATDYDDGTPEKAGTTKRTLGGGVSYSVGGIYYRWKPTIRVRHTEDESGYGDLQDLTDLFELNNPNGTPTNVITFIDHHNVSHSVLLVGSLNKAVLGSSIEGTEAHYLVRLTLQEKPHA